MKSTRVVYLLIVDVHFNIGKQWMQNAVYMSNKRNWSLLFYRLFLFCFCLIFVLLFYFFGIVSFVATTPEKFQFQSQVRLTQINVVFSIRLKFKLYAVLIEWGSRMVFLFLGRQDIVNYWDFPSKICRNGHKRLVPKINRHDQKEKFEKCLFTTDLFVLQHLLEWLCPHSVSCYHYLTVFWKSVFPHSLQLSWYSFYH